MKKFFENLNLFVLCLFCFAVLCYEFALGMMVNVDGSCIILSAHSPNPSNPSPRFCRNIHSLKNKNQKTKEKSTEKKGPDVKTRKVKVTLFVEGAIFGDTRSSIVGVSHRNTFLRDSPSTKCRMFQHKMRLQRTKTKLCKGAGCG